MHGLNIKYGAIKPPKFNDAQFVLTYSLKDLHLIFYIFSRIEYLLVNIGANDGYRRVVVYKQLRV